MAQKMERKTSRWRVIRKMAWDRDRKRGTPCHICGEPIDYGLRPSSSPLAWEPDHIQPFSSAPELELDLNNIAASHTRCNRQRGNGKQHKDVGQHSRIW